MDAHHPRVLKGRIWTECSTLRPVRSRSGRLLSLEPISVPAAATNADPQGYLRLFIVQIVGGQQGLRVDAERGDRAQPEHRVGNSTTRFTKRAASSSGTSSCSIKKRGQYQTPA